MSYVYSKTATDSQLRKFMVLLVSRLGDKWDLSKSEFFPYEFLINLEKHRLDFLHDLPDINNTEASDFFVSPPSAEQATRDN